MQVIYECVLILQYCITCNHNDTTTNDKYSHQIGAIGNSLKVSQLSFFSNHIDSCSIGGGNQHLNYTKHQFKHQSPWGGGETYLISKDISKANLQEVLEMQRIRWPIFEGRTIKKVFRGGSIFVFHACPIAYICILLPLLLSVHVQISQDLNRKVRNIQSEWSGREHMFINQNLMTKMV